MKYIVSIFITLILLSGGFYFYTISQTPEQPAATQEAITTNSIKITEPDNASPSASVKHGFYDFYSQDGFGYSKASKKVYFFFASWCPTCKTADEDFKANLTKIPEDVAIFKVHYNDPETFEEDKALAEEYGITYQHTFVQIDSDGNEITRWNGGSLNDLKENIK